MNGFKLIIIGYLFNFLDFRLQGIDIIPDFVGYLLIFIGLSKVLDLNKKFETARFISIILLILSFFELYQNPNSYQIHQNIEFFPFLLSSVITIISIIYSYCLFIGIKESAQAINDQNLVDKAQITWILTIITIIPIPLVFIMPFLAIPLIILGLIVFVFQIYTLSLAQYLV